MPFYTYNYGDVEMVFQNEFGVVPMIGWYVILS
jgi:hypothetical protein